MRVPISHSLGKEEVRRRLQSHSWPNEDRMDLAVRAMGQGVDGCVIIEDDQVVFEVNLPPALSFVEPMVASAIRKQGQKLIAPK